METAETKAALRVETRAKRDSIAVEDRKAYETALESRLLSLPAFKHAKCIATYNPVGSEARYVANVDRLFMFDQRPVIAFPIMRNAENMSFYSFDLNDDLSVLADPMRVIADMSMEHLIEPEKIDLILVPGLAFDAHGNRLGQGAGVYDRYLPHLRSGCMTIGIAFDEQIVDAVPHDVHDTRVDYIVTPSRVITAEK